MLKSPLLDIEPDDLAVEETEVENLERRLNWMEASMLLLSFAAPSAIVGVPFFAGACGWLMGPVVAVVSTFFSCYGAVLLARIYAMHPRCANLQELALVGGGPTMSVAAAVFQYANFLLFLPVALTLCAGALNSVVDPTNDDPSSPQYKYYVLGMGLLCLGTTQVRALRNARLLSHLSLVCVAAMIGMMVYVFATVPRPDQPAARPVGNPVAQSELQSAATFALGFTTAIWGYVPAFLTCELGQAMHEPRQLVKAVVFSGLLNALLVFGLLGLASALWWGALVPDPVTLDAAWPEQSALARVFSALLLLANLISYALDSVPLTRAWQTYWRPQFDHTRWTPGSMLFYLLISLPLFLVGLGLTFLVPNLFLMLAWVTAATVPWITCVIPGTAYWLWRTVPSACGRADGNPAHAELLRSIKKGASPPAATKKTATTSSSSSSSSSESFSSGGLARFETSVLIHDQRGVEYLRKAAFRRQLKAFGSFGWAEKLAVQLLIVWGVLSGIICILAAIGLTHFPNLSG